MDMCCLSRQVSIYQVTPVEEWKCHARAMEMYFEHDGENLSSQPRHNTKLSTHQQVAELAESIAAEVVVARYFGLDYSIEHSCYKLEADVGKGIEVRWTHYTSGQLIIRANDREDDVAVLVIGRSPHFQIAGWIPVSIARKPRFRSGLFDNWAVPQSSLKPIEELAGSQYGRVIR